MENMEKNTQTSSLRVASYFDKIADDFDSYYEIPPNWFQRITNEYLRKPAITKRLELSFKELNKTSSRRILDIGCGSGVLSVPLAQNGHRVLGIDFSAPMIELATERAKNADVKVQFQVEDFLKKDFSDFDDTVALGVMEYFKNPQPIIQKMITSTRCGGKIIFDIPGFFNIYFPLRLPYLLWRKTRAYFYTPRGLRRLLAPLAPQISSISRHPYGAGFVMILQKK